MLSSNIEQTLESMYSMRKELVPCFIGAPGIGKTQGIQEFAKKKNVRMVTFILSTALPSEVSGIRMPDNDTKMLEVFDDSRMASLQDGDILFFDEILEAPPALWSACLTLIQDRMLASGRRLPDVMIVAASNPVPNPGIIPPSLRDRFMFFEVFWNDRAWFNYVSDRYHRKFSKTKLDVLCHEIKSGLKEADRYGYNTLTPRRMTKVFDWYTSATSEDERKFILELVSQMFSSYISELVADAFDEEQDEAWCDAVQKLEHDFGIDFEVKPYDVTPEMIKAAMNDLDESTYEAVKTFMEGVEIVRA